MISPGGTTGSRAGNVIIAIVAATSFVAGGAWWATGHVQRDLTARSRVALAAAGIPASVRYDGVDAVLTGTVGDAAQAADAIGVVAQVPGTRHVTSRLGQALGPGGATPGSSAAAEAAPPPSPSGPPTATPSPADASSGSPAGSAVRLPRGTIHFANGNATLSARHRSYLDQVVPVLEANPQVRLVVRGHSDDVGPDEANWALSRQRADAVVRYLEERGVPADRLRLQAYAATSPVAPNDTPQGRAANRRVELTIEEV